METTRARRLIVKYIANLETQLLRIVALRVFSISIADPHCQFILATAEGHMQVFQATLPCDSSFYRVYLCVQHSISDFKFYIGGNCFASNRMCGSHRGLRSLCSSNHEWTSCVQRFSALCNQLEEIAFASLKDLTRWRKQH